MGTWDKYEQGAFTKFEEIGATVEGVMVKVSETDFGGQRADAVPVLHLQDSGGEIHEVTIDKVNLLRLIIERRPEQGDHVKITYTGENLAMKKPGRNAPKTFEVVVTPAALMGAEKAPPPPPPPPVASGGPPPASLPAVPGYPPPTAAQLADPSYRVWYDVHAPKAPPPGVPDSPETIAGEQDPF